MSILQSKNFAFSTLASGIIISSSSLTVASGHSSRFPLTGNFIGVIWGSTYGSPSQDPDRELVNMTLISGDTYSITRAQESTIAKAWDAGSNIACVITTGKFTELERYIQHGNLSYGIATGTNTYSCILDPIPASYVDGGRYVIKFSNASTGLSTLAFNSLPYKKLYGYANGVYSQISSGHITAGLVSEVIYSSALDNGGGGFILHKTNIPIAAASASISTTSESCTGNAATATVLQNSRTIGGVSFNGSANINLPGVNIKGNQNTTGNAATATRLATARTIGGVSFDGTANINLPGVNIPGNQDTSGNAATATTAAYLYGGYGSGSFKKVASGYGGVGTSTLRAISGSRTLGTIYTLDGLSGGWRCMGKAGIDGTSTYVYLFEREY